VLLRANGVDLETLAPWRALLEEAARAGTIALAVEHDHALRDVTLEITRRGGAAAPQANRFVEREKARVIAETVVLEDGATAALVVELLRGSPLAKAGLAAGDTVFAIDGERVASADQLVRALDARPYGAEVALAVHGGEEVHATLWSPPRRLTRLAVPILFDYERDLAADKTEFALIDLWILALYDYRRDVESRRHRILRFFVWETGAGQLAEEEP
jgi:hypothetical protein